MRNWGWVAIELMLAALTCYITLRLLGMAGSVVVKAFVGGGYTWMP